MSLSYVGGQPRQRTCAIFYGLRTVIVDDGSSLTKLQRFCRVMLGRDSRIHLVLKDRNEGLAVARQSGNQRQHAANG